VISGILKNKEYIYVLVKNECYNMDRIR